MKNKYTKYIGVALLIIVLLVSAYMRFFNSDGGDATEKETSENSFLETENTTPESDKPDESAEETQKGGTESEETQTETQKEEKPDENGAYYSKTDVANYLIAYGRLPGNFITKDEAKKLGWQGGALEKYAPGKAIGGDRFGNNEGLLPKKKGRTYTECDIDTQGRERGAKRIVFSNDGLIYYTDDHYESFTLLYGDPDK